MVMVFWLYIVRRINSICQKVLDLLHTDVMGPFQVKSWGGSVYTVTLMDDHSRMAEVALLQKKSDVFGCVAGSSLALTCLVAVRPGLAAGTSRGDVTCRLYRRIARHLMQQFAMALSHL